MGRRPVAAALLLGAVLILGSIALPGMRESAARGLGQVSGPIARWGAGFGRSLSAWWPGRTAADNEALASQVAALTVENASLALRIQELGELTALTDALGDRALPTLTARILIRSADPAVQVVTIDRGSADGVTVGSAIISGDGSILGRAHAVGDRTAQVLLLTDPRSRLTVEVQNAHPSAGVLVGDRGTTAQLTNVRRESPLAVGQPIVTAGIDSGVPRGIPVGSVGTLLTGPADLFQSATVSLRTLGRTPWVVAVVQGGSL